MCKYYAHLFAFICKKQVDMAIWGHYYWRFDQSVGVCRQKGKAGGDDK
jgi:hypothetical protein